MITPSLGPTGLTILRADDVKTNVRERLRGKAHWGPLVETGPGSRVGNFVDPFAEELGSAWELLQAVYDSQVPGNAEGTQLTNIAALTLCSREPATFSRVLQTFVGDEATSIPAGTRVRVPGGAIFALDAVTVIPVAETIDAWCTSTTSGREYAEIGGITQIVDAVAGLTSTTNAAAVDSATTGGHPVESDEALRYRRERSLALAGSSTDDATRARLENYDWITAAVVVSNRTDATVGILTPHSMGIHLWPAGLDPEDVAAAIYGEFGPPAGIKLIGDTSRDVIDDQGKTTTISWSALTELAIHLVIAVTTDTEGEAYPADGDTRVEAAVLGYGLALGAGRDVLPDHVRAWILGGWTDLDGATHEGVPGIRALAVYLKVGSTPTTEIIPIVVGATQIATIAANHVTVNS